MYCLTKVELTNVWSRVAMMSALISGYLGLWMDMICVAFWKITVVLCSHMSLQWQEHSVFLMAQGKQWKAQHSKCVESCWTHTSTWLPQPGHNPHETMRILVWSTWLKVWSMYTLTLCIKTSQASVLNLSFNSFLMQRIQNVKFGPSPSVVLPFQGTSAN